LLQSVSGASNTTTATTTIDPISSNLLLQSVSGASNTAISSNALMRNSSGAPNATTATTCDQDLFVNLNEFCDAVDQDSALISSEKYSNDEEQPGVHTNKKRYAEEEVVIID